MKDGVTTMKKCHISGKKPSTGNTVSHANNKTKRRWLPNVQRVRIQWEGKVQMAPVCASCIRAGKVAKAARGVNAARTQASA